MAPFRTRTDFTARLTRAALAEHAVLETYMDSVDAADSQARAGTPDDPSAGAGWFESSWELARGLQVVEYLAMDGRADGPMDSRVDAWADRGLVS